MKMEQERYELPDGWEWKKLEDIATTTSGGTPSRSKKEYWNGHIPWIKSGELNDSFIETNSEFITDEGLHNSSCNLLPKGSLLMAMYGATAGRLGILAFDAAVNQAVCCIQNNSEITERDFIKYYLLSKRKQIIQDSFGGAQPNISQKYIRSLNIPCPNSLPEQRRIADKLDAVLGRIDDAIRLSQDNLASLDDLFEATLTQALHGKLVPQNSNDEPAKILKKRIEHNKALLCKNKSIKYKTLNPIMAHELPYEIPKNWEWARIGNIFHLQAGKFIQASNIHNKPIEDYFPCYGGNGLRGYVNTYNEEGTYSLIGRQGALCGNINLATGKFYATEHAVIANDFGQIDHKWGFFFLKAINLNQYSTSTAQPGLSIANINNVLIPLPPLPEQRRIADKLDALSGKIAMQKRAIEEKLDELNHLKSSVLDAAFRGWL